jgi:hypothetical protein
MSSHLLGKFILTSGNSVYCNDQRWHRISYMDDRVQTFDTIESAREQAAQLVAEGRACLTRKDEGRPATSYHVEIKRMVVTVEHVGSRSRPGPIAPGHGWGVPGRGADIQEDGW